MDNDEIRALLRELKARSDASDEVKSKTIRITFGEDEPQDWEEERPSSFFKRKKSRKTTEEDVPVEKTRFRLKKKKTPEEADLEEDLQISDAVKREKKIRKKRIEPVETIEEETKSDESKAVKPKIQETEPEEAEKAETEVKPEGTEKADMEVSQEEVPEAEEEQSAEGEKKKQPQVSKNKTVPFRKAKAKAKKKKADDDFWYDDAEDFRESDALLLEARRNGAIGRTPWKNLKLAVGSYFDDLKAKGVGARELIMIGAGGLLVVFLAFALYSAIFAKDKSANVVAEDGLYVTVEEEPELWCTSGRVTLRIRAGSTIQSVTVNGENIQIEPSKRVTLTVNADTDVLNLMVVTEEKVLNAQAGIPMIDAAAPVMEIRQTNGQVTLNAADTGSGLEGIYYGTTVGFSDVPYFQRYNAPFRQEEGKLYYYYAKDLAGNVTRQMVSNMEPAEYLVLSESEVTLFPGDTINLKASSSPKYTYYNNLQITNKNPEVVSLEADGTITALKDGDAVIEATADGVPNISCIVKVRSQAEFTLTAIGDCTLGDDVNFNPSNSFGTVYSMYGHNYFFENVRSILAADDITFANFEGTLTTSDAREIKEYAFKGKPEYTAILQDGSIEAVSLANNHSKDYGVQSLEDTKKYLSEAGIDYCIGEDVIFKEVNGIRVALIGIYVLDTGIEKASQVESTIHTAKQHGADVIVVGFHWGSEKSNYPDDVQQSLAHTAIDCGADLVVGHHPHVLQGIELYQGKYIVYSLGNFCFGGNSNPSDTDTMIFQQTFTVDETGEATGSDINIIPCSVTSQYGWNSYQPTPQQGSEAERIMGRINEYSAQFGLTF